MHTVGKICGICDGKVILETKGAGCDPCESVWHRECLDASGLCPKCAAPLPPAAGTERMTAAPVRVNVKMQRCGKPCTTCGERVQVEAESSGCPACGLVWHLTCHSPANLCPACGKDVEKLSSAAESAKQHAAEDRRSRGKMFYWLMLSIRTVGAGLGVLAAGATLKAEGSGAVKVELFTWVAYVLVWIVAYMGVRGARVFLGMCAALGLVLLAVSSRFYSAYTIPAIAAQCFSIWVCFYSRDVKFYEASFR